MKAPLALLILLCIGVPLARAQSLPGPDLGFGHAFGYRIGAPVEAVLAHARERGDRLTCEDITDVPEITGQGVCFPESLATRRAPPPLDSLLLLMARLPPFPPYSLFTRHDSIDFLTVSLGYTPDLTRPQVTGLFDGIAPRAVEGRSGRNGSESIVWVDPRGRDYAVLECRTMDFLELCSLKLGRAPTPEALQRVLDLWRRLAPLPPSEDPPA